MTRYVEEGILQSRIKSERGGAAGIQKSPFPTASILEVTLCLLCPSLPATTKMAPTLPALRRSVRLADQKGYRTAMEIASSLESSVKRLAALEPADIEKMNRYGRWETLGSVKSLWLVHMLSCAGYDRLDKVFSEYYLYCDALFFESPELLAPAAEKLKELLMSAQPAFVLPEDFAGAHYQPLLLAAFSHPPPDPENPAWAWVELPAPAAEEEDEDLSEDEEPETCQGCYHPLKSYEHILCHDCVETMDAEYKQEKMKKKKRCDGCNCHYSVAASGIITCGCYY